MKVKLEYITPNALEFIGKLAGICYNSKDEPEANRKRAIHCKDSGHLSTLRHAHATFHVSGISRVCSHQFVRSKHLDFLQRSQRYCKENDPGFVVPSQYSKAVADYMEEAYNEAYTSYQTLLGLGVKKEDARFVLPEATCTELIVTGNMQSWVDFIKLRSGKEAQWEIRNVAIEINNQLAEECPGLFEPI